MADDTNLDIAAECYKIRIKPDWKGIGTENGKTDSDAHKPIAKMSKQVKSTSGTAKQEAVVNLTLKRH